MSPTLAELGFDELADHLAGWFEHLLPHQAHRRLLVSARRELSNGRPADLERLAEAAGVSVGETLEFLREAGGEWDPSGSKLIGWGLTGTPTPHRYRTRGHDLFTWCAVDSILFPVITGAEASIESPCVTTGDLIQIDVTPAGVQRVEPATAVVSIVTPPVEISEVRRAVCQAQNFYRSHDAAATWQAEHPDSLLLPVGEVFELYRRAWDRVFAGLVPDRSGRL